MKKTILISLIALVLIFMVWFGVQRYLPHDPHPAKAAATAATYYCPMHPSYTSDKPGDCPICGMKLVQRAAKAKPTPAKENPAPAILYYRNPMNPEISSPVPMKDGMGMDYIPVYESSSADHSARQSTVSGRSSIFLDADKRQRIGLKTALVEKKTLTHSIHASGKVAFDPELYNALNEYQSALGSAQKSHGANWPELHERGNAMLSASAQRLKQMGLSQEQINAYTRDPRTVASLLYAQGGRVWVYAQIYEYEVAMVSVGQKVTITTAAYPGRTFSGVLRSMDPMLSPETRSLKIRIEVPNADGALKLEMYVEAAIAVALGTHLAMPKSAVISTGPRSLVYVTDDHGHVEPREVQIGADADGWVQVLQGVSENEHVVVAANFLIDSESRIQASHAK